MAWKYALCSEVFKTPIETTIRKVAEIGFDGIEIAPFNIAETADGVSAERRTRIRQLSADSGIEVVGLHWLLVCPLELHMTCDDDATRTRTAAYLSSLANLCADLGGEVMILGSPKQRSLAAGQDPEEAFHRAAAVLREAAKTCEDRGVRLLIEALNLTETNFLNTIEEALALRDAVGSPGVDFMLDCKAMSGMPDGIESTIRRFGGATCHFHANEPSGKGPGMGDVDFRPILRALRESGYTGWVSTEPFDYDPDPETVARTALETLRTSAVP